MKTFLFAVLTIVLTGCGYYREPPPEVVAMRTAPPKKISPKVKETIIVDAGHGGKDAGTNSKKDGYEEKNLTLETAYLVVDCLRQLGYQVTMTRKQDVFVPLSTRAEIANNLAADLFVSIHYNFSSSKEAEGIEVYYYKEGKIPLSQRVSSSKALGQEVLKKIVTQTGADSRGVKPANFAVVRETKMPAILIEAGFLSNVMERAKINSSSYRRSLAQGIAQGIDSYLSEKREH